MGKRAKAVVAVAVAGTPTEEQWGAYLAAFGWFNEELFGGLLPPVILNFSRKNRSQGFYAEARWGRVEGEEVREVAEITLNPDCLARPASEVMSTLVHEMVHHWQAVCGRPPRAYYHNREWAEKMASLGLEPTATGKPGGKPTGQKMTHLVVTGGPFDRAFRAMPEAYLLPWTSKPMAKKTTSGKRCKYKCGECKFTLLGKAGLNIACLDCGTQLLMEDEDK